MNEARAAAYRGTAGLVSGWRHGTLNHPVANVREKAAVGMERAPWSPRVMLPRASPPAVLR